MRFICLFISFLLFPSMAIADVTGFARVVDGDTIWIGETKIRLHGIDAPESKQECSDSSGTPYRCGEASTNELKAMIRANPIRCEGTALDKYDRLIATCYAGNLDLNAEMVRRGWALAYRQYSKDYINNEVEAQVAKRGMWAGEFDKPWEWRRK